MILHGKAKGTIVGTYSTSQAVGLDIGASITGSKSWSTDLSKLNANTLTGGTFSVSGGGASVTGGVDVSYNGDILNSDGTFPSASKIMDASKVSMVGYHVGGTFGTGSAFSATVSVSEATKLFSFNPLDIFK